MTEDEKKECEKKLKKKNKLIRQETKRLRELFQDLEENTMKKAEKLIDNAAFMSVTLDELREHIKAYGVKETYMNGNNQYGYKESVEAKNFNAMIKNYMNIIKQLNDMLPVEKQKETEDEFERLKNEQ